MFVGLLCLSTLMLLLKILFVDEETHVYLVEIKKEEKESEFAIKAISEGFDKVSCDPHTHATYYWPIDTKKLLKTQTNTFLFLQIGGEKHLREAPLSLQEVIDYLGIDPKNDKPKEFNKQVGQQILNEWSNNTFALNTLGNNVVPPVGGLDVVISPSPLIEENNLNATLLNIFGTFSNGTHSPIIDEVDEPLSVFSSVNYLLV
ncbi:hypothetical protein Lbru_1666 [Legionella brunensis]|uniref:Uncharacterized protein n=1 Tax=Legionella brunensis TaxID=29422 RepID=A0A0W0SK79_9GAMM|nr:hypothetical protein Lbru_1666 [Legionella brunensis]